MNNTKKHMNEMRQHLMHVHIHSIFNNMLASWIWMSSVLRPSQHSIGYMEDDFYRSKDPTNSIKVLKEKLQRKNKKTQTTKYTYTYTIIDNKRIQI